MKLIKKLLILVLVLIFRFSLSEAALKVHTSTTKNEMMADCIKVKNINEREKDKYEEIKLKSQ